MAEADARVDDVAPDASMQVVQSPDLVARLVGGPVHDPEVRLQRSRESSPGIDAKVGVLGNAGGNERVRDLEQEGPRARAEQEHRLAIEPPRLARWAVEAAVDDLEGRGHAGSIESRLRGRGSYRSPGRRPTNHHAAGNAAAASASLIASQSRNGTRPLAMALLRSPP